MPIRATTQAKLPAHRPPLLVLLSVAIAGIVASSGLGLPADASPASAPKVQSAGATTLHISRFLTGQFLSRGEGVQLVCTTDQCGYGDIRLLFTRNAGATWTMKGSAPGYSAQFLHPRLGFAGRLRCSGRKCRISVFRTKDGGGGWARLATFSIRSDPDAGSDARVQLDMESADRGWMETNGQLFGTSNGGSKWKRVDAKCPKQASTLKAISFRSATAGLVECEGEPAIGISPKAILRTSDAGRSWSVVSSNYRRRGTRPIAARGYASQLDQVSGRLVYLVLDGNGVFRSTNAGKTFSRLHFVGDKDSITSASWPSHKLGYMTLGNGGLFRSRDGGATWKSVPVSA